MKMVDISDKREVSRRATAIGEIKLKQETCTLIRAGKIEKGDPLTVAEISAINGVKESSRLLTFSHQIPLESVTAQAKLTDSGASLVVSASAHYRTGVEMDALTGVAIGLLNLWDMVKKYEKDDEGQYPSTVIHNLRVLEKVKEK